MLCVDRVDVCFVCTKEDARERQKSTCDVKVLLQHVSYGGSTFSLHSIISQIQLQNGGVGYQGNCQGFATLQSALYYLVSASVV